MKKLTLTVCFAIMALVMPAQTNNAPQLRPDNIDEVVAAMTLEEKVNLLHGCGMSFGEDVKFPGTAGRTFDIPRLGIPSVYMADGPHRLAMAAKRDFDSHTYNTTEFPSSATVAATFNPQTAFLVGKTLGTEVKDYGMDVLLAPGVNLMRNVLCGRNHEYYAEDPVLAGTMAGAYINGVQSEGIAACLKHFAVNSQETNRNNGDSRLTARPLRELYLKCFEIAVKTSHPWSIMTAYNKVNGKFTCEDRDLTETILRDEWGWNGLVMSDWNAGKDAVASIKAGNDMLQPGQDRQRQAILEAAKNGSLDMSLVDLSCKRILEFVVKCHTYNGYKYANRTDLYAHSQISRAAGAEGIVLLSNCTAALPMKNVKNVALYGTTSYDMVPAGMGFGSTGFGYYTVSLVEGMRNAGIAADKTLAKKYVKHIADEKQRLYPNGLPPFSLTPPLRAEEFTPSAEELAAEVANNDMAIITIGRTSGEGCDRRKEEFYLKQNELNLIKAVSEAYHKAGKKLVVVLNICSAVETASWRGMADAVVCAFQPGMEVGNCIADVLTGKVNPSGKLPMTFALNYGDAASDQNYPYDYEFKMPEFAFGTGINFELKKKEEAKKEEVRNVDYTLYEEGVYVGYRYFDTFGKEVAYPFGYGLSYTTFGYNIEEATLADGKCTVKVAVKNTGSVAGREAVQIYTSAPKGGLDKPKKELKAFAKSKNLNPGETEVMTFTFDAMDMASFNEKTSAWELPKGDYQIHACASSAHICSTATVKVAKAEKRVVHKAMLPQVKINTLASAKK